MLRVLLIRCNDDFTACLQLVFVKEDKMATPKRSVAPRRDFLKAGAVALSALPIVSGGVYAQGSDVLKIGLVGCGGAGLVLLRRLFARIKLFLFMPWAICLVIGLKEA